MKKCVLCDNKITEKNNASACILGVGFLKEIKDYQKEQVICTTCKSQMLYANIQSPW